jgi:tetratricopeptide (TPR) repeat protein
MLVLGIKPGATAAELKATYRDLAREWHPDKHQTDPRKRRAAEDKLREINQAYTYLMAQFESAVELKTRDQSQRPAQPGYDAFGWKDSVAQRGRKENWEEADEEFYARALRLYLEGKEHFERARWNEAVSSLLQSVYMVQENAEAYRLLGRAYRRLMMPAKAESAYRQAVRIQPGSPDAVYELGEVYVLMNDFTSAMQQAAVLDAIDVDLAKLLRRSIDKQEVAV